MTLKPINNIVFLGAGNLAVNLSEKIKNAGFNILQVYSRTESSACALAQKLETKHTCKIEEIFPDADLYICALSDKALIPVLEQLKINNGIVVHTAGSIPIHVLSDYFQHYGVFYPLQTFTKGRTVHFSKVPICVEGGSLEVKEVLLSLGRSISEKVCEVSSEQRKQLHLASVFACNFTNHMYCIAQDLIEKKGLDFEMLRPLIYETACKVQEMKPKEAQTGPAARSDEKTIGLHEEMLKSLPELQKLYKLVTQNIRKI